jgi:threonine aldolase
LTARPVDLRSDTATLPTAGMRKAMAEAELGDDVFGEDPTVNRLEARVAELFGKDAAMFVPSGTMSNQIAIRMHVRPGDEILCEASSHIHLYEGGGPAALSGATVHAIPGRGGIVDLSDFEGKIRPESLHSVRTRLVSLENTHNRGNGAVLPLANVERISGWARKHGLAVHLDGARLMNAVVKTGVPPKTWATHFDSVSLCFSKGLGCPVGSILIGGKDFIKEARRIRKLFGGAMRQAGVLAAAALYALDHHVERLAEDHANGQIIAQALEASSAFKLKAAEIETNIIWAPMTGAISPADFAAQLKSRGIIAGPFGGDTLRFCTHLGVTKSDAERIASAIREIGGG